MRRIHTSRIMGTGMEHEAGVIICLVDIIHHALEIQHGRLSRQISVVTRWHTSIAENGVLIGPSRVREIDLASDIAVLKELSKKTEGTRTRNSLSIGNHILLLIIKLITPSKLAGSIIESRNTNQRRILMILSTTKSLLSFSYTRKNVRLYKQQ